MDNNAFIDKLDSFLTGKMSASETSAFRSAAEQDPLLKSELQLQEDILNSIKEHRKAELKANLSQVPVSAGLTVLQKVGIGASTLVAAGLIAYGIFSFTQPDSDNLVNQENSQPEFITSPSEPISASVPETKELNTASDNASSKTSLEEADPYAQMGESTEANEVEVHALPLEEVVTPNTEEEATVEVQPTIAEGNGFMGSELGEDPEIKIDANSSEPKGVSGNSENTTSMDHKKPNLVHSRKDFHYHYTGEDFTLYGEFDKSNPYSLIDLNYNSQLYFHYEGTFYKIEVTKSKMPLEDQKVSDPLIIDKLEQYIRTNR